MTVFVLQDQQFMRNGQLVPKFDFSPASEFGEISFLLGHNANPLKDGMGSIEQDLVEKLSKFSDEDYIVLTGNPVLIALAGQIATTVNDGRAKYLQWNGVDRKYNMIQVDPFADLPRVE